jgi:Holliday junction resolvase
MSESAIEKKVCDFARAAGCIVMKLSGANQRGQPDRLFIRMGRVLFIEFKAPGKTPTELQHRWIHNLTVHGMSATWCDSVASGIDAITSHLLSE